MTDLAVALVSIGAFVFGMMLAVYRCRRLGGIDVQQLH